jgi:hypothetical protein
MNFIYLFIFVEFFPKNFFQSLITLAHYVQIIQDHFSALLVIEGFPMLPRV